MLLSDRLRELIDAAFTGLWVQTYEPDEAIKEIQALAAKETWQVVVKEPDPELDPVAVVRALLSLESAAGKATLLVLPNFTPYLGESRDPATRENGESWRSRFTDAEHLEGEEFTFGCDMRGSFRRPSPCVAFPLVGRERVTFGIAPLDSILHEVAGWTVPLTDTELPKYMVVGDGRVQFWDDGKNHGPILAHTRDVAERYVAEMDKRQGIKFSVADIQAEIGSSVGGVLDLLVETGTNCALVIRSVADDGETKSDFIYPAKPPAE